MAVELSLIPEIYKPESKYVPHIKNYLKAYVADEQFRDIINSKHFAELNVYLPCGNLRHWRDAVPEYVKDYVPVNQYMK